MKQTKKQCDICKQHVCWKHVLFTFDGLALCRKCFDKPELWKGLNKSDEIKKVS